MTSVVVFSILIYVVGASSQLFLPLDIDPSLAEQAEIGYGLRVQKEIAMASARIVGGQEAAPGKYPFFVRLRGIQGSSTCGGSLVAPDVVLTAAHCDTTFDDTFTAAVNGYTSANVNNLEEIRAGTSQKMKHPDFDINTFAYDFMLLKLDVTIPREKIMPLQLNRDPNVPVVNDPVTLIGLGTLSEIGNQFPTYLQEVVVNTVNTENCFESYSSAGLDIVRNDIMFCAQGEAKDGCQGDSGSPIISAEGLQLGVVSFGLGCARPEYPGVYSRVTGVQEWLDASMCELSDFCKNGVFVYEDDTTATDSPVTSKPVSEAPVSKMPISSSPITSSPESAAPVTASPVSNSPTTSTPVSMAPSTNVPITSSPITSSPVSEAPTTSVSDLTGTDGPGISAPSHPPNSIVSSSVAPITGMPASGAPITSATALNNTTAPITAGPTGQEPSGSASPSESTPVPTFESRLQTTKPDSSAADEIANPDGARGAGVCDDFLNRTFSVNIGTDRRDQGRGDRDCGWLQSQSKAVQDQFCVPGSEAYEACEETCGKCSDFCRDEQAAVFLVFVGTSTLPEARGCNWLTSRPAMKTSVCVEGHDAFSVCPETCNACGSESKFAIQGPFDLMFDALATRNRSTDSNVLADRLRRQEDQDTDNTRVETRSSNRVAGSN